jgi:hypothetical protein
MHTRERAHLHLTCSTDIIYKHVLTLNYIIDQRKGVDINLKELKFYEWFEN